MIYQRVMRPSLSRFVGLAFLVTIVLLLVPANLAAQNSKPPTPKSAPAPAKPATTHSSAKTSAAPPKISTAPNAKTTTIHKPNGSDITKGPRGNMVGYKGANGHEAKFGRDNRIKEVHANGLVVSRLPGGTRRTVFERPDKSRLVAYGHGRGYVQHPYTWGGHAYYARAYYYHGSYYRAYYHPYYYHGVYLYGYLPVYYYPPAYYGWAYVPWPTPVPYAWGWVGYPWYGYYGAYFAPYPVYPSAAYWIADYLIAASLADAYATTASQSDSAHLEYLSHPLLVYASYDPDAGTISPAMTKDVKDAISEEIKRVLAAQKTQDPTSGNAGSLATLLADGQPHVFVVNTGLTVGSSAEECNLTEGDILGLDNPPAQDATSASLRVLASKGNDCAKGASVSVELTDLQEMENHLLSNIDRAMAEMKEHPGQGGLPAPPAEAIQGTKEAPYTATAPAADPNGATELDQTAQQGAQTEQQVVAEASASDETTVAEQKSGSAPVSTSQSGQPNQPIVIVLGLTEAQVIAGKGQPTNIVKYPDKTTYIYPDMKIIFVNGKVSDVQ